MGFTASTNMQTVKPISARQLTIRTGPRQRPQVRLYLLGLGLADVKLAADTPYPWHGPGR